MYIYCIYIYIYEHNGMVYRDQQHKIQTTIFHKRTDQQTYLHAQSNHPKSLKDNIQ